VEPNTVPSIYKPGEGEEYYFSSRAADRLPTDRQTDGRADPDNVGRLKKYTLSLWMHLVASSRQ